jgi:acetyltransferase-like isoleucine patch superfamily enzyme
MKDGIKELCRRLAKQYKLFVTRELHNSIVGKDVIREMFTIVRDSTLDDYVEIKEGSIVKKSKVGTGSSINGNCCIENVTTGQRVQIAYGCNIVGVTHDHSQLAINHLDVFNEISIGADSFIGMGCIILPGVKIGEFCIVAAGAVLNKNIPNGNIYIGTPQKPILRERKCLKNVIGEYSDPEFLADGDAINIDALISKTLKQPIEKEDAKKC